MLNVFLRCNKEESDTDPWVALSLIMGGLNISDATTKTTTRKKLISLLSRNIPQTASGRGKTEIMETYPSGKQYLASPETKERRKYLRKFARAEIRRGQSANDWQGYHISN